VVSAGGRCGQRLDCLCGIYQQSASSGQKPFDAAIEAGGKRIRPIILTTVTTVFGLFPTAYGSADLTPF
jgi:multidrug efflux pump